MFLTSEGKYTPRVKLNTYLLKGLPSGPIKNFSKFQEMSLRFTGDQMMSLGSSMREVGSSAGSGSAVFRYWRRGGHAVRTRGAGGLQMARLYGRH